jgi:hypothetical protein
MNNMELDRLSQCTVFPEHDGQTGSGPRSKLFANNTLSAPGPRGQSPHEIPSLGLFYQIDPARRTRRLSLVEKWISHPLYKEPAGVRAGLTSRL